MTREVSPQRERGRSVQAPIAWVLFFGGLHKNTSLYLKPFAVAVDDGVASLILAADACTMMMS